MQVAPEALNTLLPRWWDWLQNQATEGRLAAALNPLDAPGDGEALFAEWLLGGGITPRERSQLAREIDGGTAIVHGQPMHAERTEITGTEGDDVLTGTVDADWIQGLAGNDLIYSDPGSDTIDGGTGTDYYNINYSDSTSAMVMVFDPTTGNGSITIGSEVDTLTSIEGFIHPIYWLGGQFIGTPFDDILLGSNFSEIETADGGGIRGGDGNDSISGNGGDDILYGEAGDDILHGNDGKDILYGGEGNDQNFGDADNDLIYSDPGSDSIDGGTGKDYYIINYSSSTSAMVMVFDPTTGNGSITIGSEVDTLTSIEAFIHPYFWAGGKFIGTPFDDVMLGSNFSEIDTYGVGGIRGGDGNDSISGNGGDDILYGEAGDDILHGNDGNDTLYGGEGDDQSFGDAGEDLIYSDPGSDTIDGGTGTDYYNINYSDSTSAMVMVFDPTTGNGSITIGSEVDTLTSIEAFINPYYWAGWQFIGTPFNDVLLGSDSSEVNTVGGGGIRGGDGNDSISGNGGHDILYGEAGDDILDGGAGDDDLDGSEGNDNLIGSAPPNGGIDTLLGGDGNDLFVLADAISVYYDDANISSTGLGDHGSIADFDPSQDRIRLLGTSIDYQLITSGSDSNLWLDKPGSEPDELIAVIRNHTSLDLAASYFEYLVPAGQTLVTALDNVVINDAPAGPFSASASLSQQPGDQRLQAIGSDHSSLDMGGSDTISDTTVQISATVDSSGAVATAIGLNASTIQLRPGDDTITIEALISGSASGRDSAVAVRDSLVGGNRGDDTVTLRGTYWGDRALVFGGAGNDTITGYGIGRDSFIQAGDGNDVVSLGRIETTSGAAPLQRAKGDPIQPSTYRGGAGFDVLHLRETTQFEFKTQATPFSTANESGWLFQGARFSGFEQVLFG